MASNIFSEWLKQLIGSQEAQAQTPVIPVIPGSPPVAPLDQVQPTVPGRPPSAPVPPEQPTVSPLASATPTAANGQAANDALVAAAPNKQEQAAFAKADAANPETPWWKKALPMLIQYALPALAGGVIGSRGNEGGFGGALAGLVGGAAGQTQSDIERQKAKALSEYQLGTLGARINQVGVEGTNAQTAAQKAQQEAGVQNEKLNLEQQTKDQKVLNALYNEMGGASLIDPKTGKVTSANKDKVKNIMENTGLVNAPGSFATDNSLVDYITGKSGDINLFVQRYEDLRKIKNPSNKATPSSAKTPTLPYTDVTK